MVGMLSTVPLGTRLSFGLTVSPPRPRSAPDFSPGGVGGVELRGSLHVAIAIGIVEIRLLRGLCRRWEGSLPSAADNAGSSGYDNNYQMIRERFSWSHALENMPEDFRLSHCRRPHEFSSGNAMRV